jgi:Apea-like HEPN
VRILVRPGLKTGFSYRLVRRLQVPTLSAKFILEVNSPCLLVWPDGQTPELVATLGAFHVATKLLSVEHWRTKGKDDVNWTTGLSELEIEVSRNEVDTLPDLIVMPDGKTDLTVQSEYLRSRLPEYQAAAREIANRILRFFQYSLLTPQVRQISTWHQSLHNPTWFDTNGQELPGGTHTVMAQPVPGMWGGLGARKLTPTELPELQSFLVMPQEPSLALALLSDAQAAWFDDNLRRSVLELAICAEVMVKRRFFAQDSPAGAAFDYLEDKAKISVRVLELLDSVAEEAFACSYKKQEPDNYQKIDHLFRCRNKIAHRGELTFRDDSGKTVDVDAALVETWWHAVASLRTWLQSL